MTIKMLTKDQFGELIGREFGYFPGVHEEIRWFSSEDGTRIGAVIRDLIDDDFSWVMLERDAAGRFRCVDLNCSLPSAADARAELVQQLQHPS